MSLKTELMARASHSSLPILTDPDSLLTEVQAATLLGFSVRTLQGWRLRGGGPRIIKVGRAVRYKRADLEAWVEAHATASTSSEGVK